MSKETDIFEIRFHARAGQGAKSAAQFVAEAALEEGKYIQAFPFYGPEREGAPMQAFVRISEKPIRLHSEVISPEAVIIIDAGLIKVEDVTSGLCKDCFIIINTKETPEKIKEELDFDGQVYTVDASTIAKKHLKKDIPNTVLVGALLKARPELVDIEKVKTQVRKKFMKKYGPEMTEANIKAIDDGYNQVQS